MYEVFLFWEVLITGGRSQRVVMRLSGFMREALISGFTRTRMKMMGSGP